MTTEPSSDPNDPAAQTYQQPVQSYDDSMRLTYSSFWAVGLVFVVLSVIYTINIVNLYGRREKLENLMAEYKRYVPRAKIIDATLNGLSGDIIDMAATHPTAKQIVNDFKIQRINPPADKASEETSSASKAK